MTEDWQAQFRELMRLAKFTAADGPKTPPQRWLTPAELRQAASEWVDGRNRIADSRQRLFEESGILTSEKWEYVVPDYLEEPMYSAVLDLMVERGEWPTEPGTSVPMYKNTPTINYSFSLNGRK
jgi:hypothetical protein